MSGVEPRPTCTVLATLLGRRGTSALIALTMVVSVSVSASAATVTPRYKPDPTLRATVSAGFNKVETAMRKWVACHSCPSGAQALYEESVMQIYLLDRVPGLRGRDLQAYLEAREALKFHALVAATQMSVLRMTDRKAQNKKLALLSAQMTSAHTHAVKAAKMLGIRTAL